MIEKGYRGISFPFRIGVRGGVVMSSTTIDTPTHIIEAYEQILLTRPMERGMEYHFKSDIDYSVFDPNDISTHTLIEYQVREALRLLDDRTEVLTVKVSGDKSLVFVDINFRVLNADTQYQTRIRLGGVGGE